MTREETKKNLPLITAYAEGKTIQYYDYGRKDWVTIDVDPSFCCGFKWRIKPEPKYRPFETEKECWNEMLKHEPFGWIEVDVTYKSIASVQEKYLYLNGENSLRHYSTLFRDATFADGQPFGIKVGETDK